MQAPVGMCIMKLFLALVIAKCNGLNVIINRVPTTTDIVSPSKDLFTNKYPERKNTSCRQHNATCENPSCKTCQCNDDLVWLSFAKGCRSRSYLDSIKNGNNCFTHDNPPAWIPTIGQNFTTDLQIRLHRGPESPSDISTIRYQCQISKVNAIADEVGALDEQLQDQISIVSNNSTKYVKFSRGLDLKNASGMLLSLDIKCTNGTSNASACFVFKVSGIHIVEVIPIPSTRPDGKNGNDDDDSVIEIVKPVVIVGCILLVFVGVFVYCCYKRRQFLKEQKERKISVAASNGDRRSVVTMSGWMNHGARNAAKMSTVTVLGEDVMYNPTSRNLVIDMPYTKENGGFTNDFEEETNQSSNPNNDGNGASDALDGPPITLSTNINNNNNNDDEKNSQSKLDDHQRGLPKVDSENIDTEKADVVIEPTNETYQNSTVLETEANENVDPNTSQVGEPLSNSTRKSDCEEEDSDVGDDESDDPSHIQFTSKENPMLHDVSGSSLPSLSGSLPSNDFFDQMMIEYDKINTLPRRK